MIEQRDVEISVNGVLMRGRCDPRTTLVDFLKEELAKL